MDLSLVQFDAFGTCYPLLFFDNTIDANIFVILLICVSSGMAKGVFVLASQDGRLRINLRWGNNIPVTVENDLGVTVISLRKGTRQKWKRVYILDGNDRR